MPMAWPRMGQANILPEEDKMRPLAQSDGVGRMEDYGTLQLANCNQIELGCIYIYSIYGYIAVCNGL